MAATLRVSSVSLNGELGEMRANDVQLAWRGSSGAIVVVDLSSVKSAEWSSGRLSLLHGDAQTLTLEGLGAEHYEGIGVHLEHAHVFLGNHEAQSAPLPTLLGSAANIDTKKFGGAIKPQLEPEEPRAAEESTAPVQQSEESQKPSARGALVQRRIASSDDDEGLSCLFNEGFAPKACDARSHPYFLSDRNAPYGVSLFEGLVWKQSAWVKRWERRYLVLSTTGLFSYKGRGEVTPSMTFDRIVSCNASEDTSGRKGFCVATRDGLLVRRHFIAAENDATRDQWVTKIHVALVRHQH